MKGVGWRRMLGKRRSGVKTQIFIFSQGKIFKYTNECYFIVKLTVCVVNTVYCNKLFFHLTSCDVRISFIFTIEQTACYLMSSLV